MNALVIATHPDDEVLGCGGTICRFTAGECDVRILHVTGPPRQDAQLAASVLGVRGIAFLEFEPARLDETPTQELVDAIRNAVNDAAPEIVYVPFVGDAHGDHRVVFRAAIATCVKSFRCPSVKRVLAYETLSETEVAFDPSRVAFRPNAFVNVGAFVDRKIAAMRAYASEIGEVPFPRSPGVIRALATFRGSTAGCGSAEAFMLVKEVT